MQIVILVYLRHFGSLHFRLLFSFFGHFFPPFCASNLIILDLVTYSFPHFFVHSDHSVQGVTIQSTGGPLLGLSITLILLDTLSFLFFLFLRLFLSFLAFLICFRFIFSKRLASFIIFLFFFISKSMLLSSVPSNCGPLFPELFIICCFFIIISFISSAEGSCNSALFIAVRLSSRFTEKKKKKRIQGIWALLVCVWYIFLCAFFLYYTKPW